MSMRPRHRFQYTIVVQGVAIFAVVWGAMLALALWHGGGHWPTQAPASAQLRAVLPPNLQKLIPPPPSAEERWETFITVLLAEFALWTKTWGMFRRSPRRDALVVSIILVNLAFVYVYWFIMAGSIYPTWFTGVWWRRSVRWPIIVTALWATIQASRLPDPDESSNYVLLLEQKVDRLELQTAALESYVRALTAAQPAPSEGV